MPDIGLIWTDFGADIAVDETGILEGSELKSAVIVSLFSDARAKQEQLPEGEVDRRGWWASPNEQYGSLIWVLAREKVTKATAERAKDFCRQALQWLVDDGIATAIEVVAEIKPLYSLAIWIKIKRGANKAYDYLWEDIEQETYKFNQGSLIISFD